ncbi:FAD-binding domain-containing protein [Thiomicrospira microaerophila]|uniref:FAD-binding domain-containing protein n=1 Tax=Thiomicrospira microaerophila TaxID=406020 RepID=UPI0005CB7FA5|nr:FAD-binding domain-containing protein [Thiomicrospira microaerophila]
MASCLQTLTSQFENRQAMIDYFSLLMPSDSAPLSEMQGGMSNALTRISQLNLEAYSRDRNYLTGHVSRLSPYIRHGLLSVADLNGTLAQQYPASVRARFIQQLAWRDYFHQMHSARPTQVWQDAETYKTGFSAKDYAQALPEDIALGQTGIKLIDQLIDQLLTQGYLHNHARLYLASYVVHWRRVAWQVGARWFLVHLLDGDIASNNYSWQWVASTFSAKPYIFNLDNLRRFAGETLDCDHPTNALFDASYEALAEQLFPYLTSEANG